MDNLSSINISLKKIILKLLSLITICAAVYKKVFDIKFILCISNKNFSIYKIGEISFARIGLKLMT